MRKLLMQNPFIRWGGLLLLGVLPGLVPASISAQAPQPVTDTLPAYVLAPVLVDVLRVPVHLDRVPFAVSVIDVERGSRQSAMALDEVLRAIPGVQVDHRYHYAVGERVSVRGFGARSQFGVRGVKILVDGIPATLPDGQSNLDHVDIGTLGRIEVIRGPASALYGNASGGVIRLQTERPPPTPIAARARAVTGGDGLINLQGRVAGSRDGPGYLVGVSHLRSDGFREHSAADATRLNVGVGVHAGPGTLRLLVQALDSHALHPGSLSEAHLLEDRSQAFAFNRVQRTGKATRHAQAGLAWLAPLKGTDVEMSVFGGARSVENPIPQRIIDLDRRSGGARALVSGGRRFRWSLGAETEIQRDDRQNHVNERGDRQERVLDQLEHVTSGSGSAQLLLPLGGRVDLLGGLRYDGFRFSVRDRLVTADDPDDSGVRTMEAWSPVAGITVRAVRDLAFFANVARAFETPTTTELANRPDGAGGFNPELQPQRATSMEAGLRGTLGPMVRWELAGYHARVTDALVPFEVAEVSGRQFYRNVGRADHRGVEVGITFAPAGAFSLRTAYAWTDARVAEAAEMAGPPAGNRIPGVVPHLLDVAGTVRLGSLVLDLDVRAASAIPVDDANLHRSPAYTVVDARMKVPVSTPGTVRLVPFLGVRNVRDTKYNASVVVNAFGGRFYEPAPGRRLYLGGEMEIAPARGGAR
jgi:iron complex outermembrane recepter protein